MTKEVMQLALDALEDAWLDGAMGRGDVARHNKAITALREALAAPQPAAKTDGQDERFERTLKKRTDRESMAAPQPAQQEPVAGLLVGQDSDGRYVSIEAKAHADTLPLGEYNLYTALPQRQQLTDELLRKIHHEDQFGLFCDYDEFEQIVRATEAAHSIGAKQ